MITLSGLFITLENRFYTAMKAGDEERLRKLRITFNEMLEASYGEGNENFCVLLEDLEYAFNHIGLADFKAEAAIPSDEQIKAVFQVHESP